MAEAIEETALPDVAEHSHVPGAAAPGDPIPGSSVPAPVASAREIQERSSQPEATFGDTPLSAIERLSISADLSTNLRRRDRFLTAAWAASFAILAALGVAGYTERNSLMRQWPASKRVYATLGLVPPDTRTDDAVPRNVPPGDGAGQRPAATPPR